MPPYFSPQAWCLTESLDRQWQDDLTRTVREVLSEERGRLMPLPASAFPCEERLSVTVDKTPYVRFDLNDYTVPAHLVGRTVTLTASLDTVRILDGINEVVAHPRCYERGREIKKQEHIDAIKEIKAGAAMHGSAHVLCDNVPSAAALLERMAERRLPLASATKQLLSMLHTYGPAACERALQEALANNAPHPHAVRHILERERQHAGKRPALELPFADDARIQQLVVKAPDLQAYDNLGNKTDESKQHHKP